MADPDGTGKMMKKELVLALEQYQQYIHQHKGESYLSGCPPATQLEMRSVLSSLAPRNVTHMIMLQFRH